VAIYNNTAEAYKYCVLSLKIDWPYAFRVNIDIIIIPDLSMY